MWNNMIINDDEKKLTKSLENTVHGGALSNKTRTRKLLIDKIRIELSSKFHLYMYWQGSECYLTQTVTTGWNEPSDYYQY